MSSYRMTLTCPAGCQYAVSLNDSGYPAEHDEHRSMTAMVEHLAAEHPDYVRAAWAAKAEREYFERVILPDRVRSVEAELSSLLPAMSDLVEFLLARIAEDEHEAEGMAVWDDGSSQRRALAECETKRRIVTEFGSQCGDYIDPNNPDDVAREQEFRKHAGEDRYQQYVSMGLRTHWPAGYCSHCDGCAAAQSADRDHERVLRLLATVYADHADYRAEWRP